MHVARESWSWITLHDGRLKSVILSRFLRISEAFYGFYYAVTKDILHT